MRLSSHSDVTTDVLGSSSCRWHQLIAAYVEAVRSSVVWIRRKQYYCMLCVTVWVGEEREWERTRVTFTNWLIDFPFESRGEVWVRREALGRWSRREKAKKTYGGKKRQKEGAGLRLTTKQYWWCMLGKRVNWTPVEWTIRRADGYWEAYRLGFTPLPPFAIWDWCFQSRHTDAGRTILASEMMMIDW